jgi:hypothetical protein
VRALLVTLLVPALAHADSFEEVAQKATPVARLDDVVWAFAGTCNTGDEIQQRQCRIVRDQRVKELAGSLLLVEADASALEVSKWNAQKRSLSVRLTACIRCAGIDVEGKKWFLMGAGGAPRFDGGKLKAAALEDTARVFDDEAAATRYGKLVANAKVTLVVKAPTKWAAAGNNGMSFEVVAYRALAPCDGSVIVAKPPAQSIGADKKACNAPAVDPDAPKPEKLPAEISPAQIKDLMQPVVDAANACFARYKASGQAKLTVVFSADGSVVEYVQQGDFVGTPTASCIDSAAKKVTFPRSQKARTKFGFPIVLK